MFEGWAGRGACRDNTTYLSWASWWMLNTGGGYASCGYATAINEVKNITSFDHNLLWYA